MTESKVQHIGAQEAFDLMKKEPSTAFIDVRSDMEYLFIGHPVGAVNIPWIDEPDFVINPDFEREVRKLILGGVIASSAHDSVPVVLICRSGNRSEEAGNLLIEHGFRHVYNIKHGFEGELDDDHHRSTIGGWRFEGLPWEQC
ncbi:MAG: rhodanese-like domain-containing protein [Gammaproteobacteria bacterium]|nr:rhodanese-like domain-containing protein [Gammaproteobacteria bacterium]